MRRTVLALAASALAVSAFAACGEDSGDTGGDADAVLPTVDDAPAPEVPSQSELPNADW